MDIDRLILPLELLASSRGIDPEALVTAVEGEVAAEARRIVGSEAPIEAEYDPESMRIEVLLYCRALADPAGQRYAVPLAQARAFDVQIDDGEELGFELLALDEAQAALLAISEQTWQQLRIACARACRRALRRAFHEAERAGAAPLVEPSLKSEALSRWRRDAWVPEVCDEAPGTSPGFGGLPLLAAGEAWPACSCCGEPRELLLQLDLAELPGRAGEGLLQLFSCTNRDADCVDAVDAQLLRSVAPDRPSTGDLAAARAEQRALRARCLPKRITGWRRVDDYPDVALVRGALRKQRVDPELYELYAPLRGDKLGGWPAWIEGGGEPRCPRCGQAGKLLLQLESDGLTDVAWGDGGRAFVLQCEGQAQHVWLQREPR